MINASLHALHSIENVEILLPEKFGLHDTLYEQMKDIFLYCVFRMEMNENHFYSCLFRIATYTWFFMS